MAMMVGGNVERDKADAAERAQFMIKVAVPNHHL